MKLKKLVSIVVASAMLTSAAVTTAFAEGDTDTWYASGDGTSDNPYVINTADQLKGFRDAVNDGACGTLASDNSITGAKHLYVELGADIDLGNVSWTPIGTGANTFRGTFDGNNHIISNLKIDKAVSSLRVAKSASYGSQYDANYADVTDSTIYGLFATADDLYHRSGVKGAIKNLGIENVDVAISGEGKKRTSVLVAAPGAHTHIENCYVKNVNVNSTATGDTYFGALAGHSENNFELKSSYVSGLTFTSNQSDGRVIFSPLSARSGGSTISDCYSADVTVNKNGNATVYATNSHYGMTAPTNVYSTFEVKSPLKSGPMFNFNASANTWAASQSATLVSDADLKSLTGVSFTEENTFVQNNSGGYPKLSWESNKVVYELTAGMAEGGSVELSSNTVAQGSEVTITVTPNANYSVVNIMANDESIWTGDSTTAVSETHTPTANTTYTATFKKELDPSLGKYIDPYQSKVYNTLDLNTASGSTTSAKDCTLNPAAYTVANNNDHFTLSTGSEGKDVNKFRFYNAMWGTRLLLKSTYDFDIKVNANDLSGVADGEIASVGTAYQYEQSIDKTESNVQVKLVFEKKNGGYQWALYKDNKGTYTAIGDKTVPAELGKYYHITYDIDATIAQARIKITPDGDDTQVIESSATGITRTYAWAFAAANYTEVSESVYKGTKGNLSTAYLNFKKEATIDMKGFSTTTDKFICPSDIVVGCEGSVITATVDTYAIKPMYNGTWNPTTPPLYIAIFNQNKAFKDAAIGQITDSTPASTYMLYKPTASLDVSGLENGTYTVKVMLWSDSQVPFKGAVKKTLTVYNGTYTLN